MSEENLPTLSPVSDADLQKAGLPTSMEMSPALAIFFNDAMYNRCKQIAGIMAKAEGFTPKHLLGKPEACFMVISRSVVWKLDPSAVAMSTYQTPGGAIGFEGKLVQAILENSGQIEGPVKYKLTGDWGKVRGKIAWATSDKNKKYAVQGWKPEDEEGLGVTVSAKVKGELEARSEDFLLASFQPRNSTLWALRPEQQIKYAACRAFANTAMPGILLGIAFDVDPVGLGESMQDITPPKPKASEFERHAVRDNPKLAEFITKANFANTLNDIGTLRKEGMAALPAELHGAFEEVCDARARQITSSEAKTDGPSKDGEPEEVQGDPRDEQEKVAVDEEPAKVETPFQRGQRLLTLIKEPADVRDVMETIGEELKGKDLKLWNETCQARFSELGGAGKIKTGP